MTDSNPNDLSPRASALFGNQALRNDIEQLRVAVLRKRFAGNEQQDQSVPTQQIQRNAVVLNRSVRRASRRDQSQTENVVRAAVFTARTYEQLAEASRQPSPSLLLTAAINYQLGGYQANAATLARQAAPLPALSEDDGANFAQLASMFLQRRFLRLAIAGSEDIVVEPAVEDRIDESDVVAAARAVTRQGLVYASRYFLSGEAGQIDRARGELNVAYGALADVGAVLESNIVDGLLALIPHFAAASIWTNLAFRLPGNALWLRYLKALGRGFSAQNVADSRSVSELWPSQLSALNAGLLENGSRIVRMPTSAGKTRIAEMAIVYNLAAHAQSSALYVAPFNALTDELASGFNDLFVDLGLTVSSFSGSYEIDELLPGALEEDLLVVTPEKLDQLMRNDSAFLARVSVVILDEGHIVAEPGRGVKYELSVSRLRKLRPEATFISLSAVVPDDTLEDFSNWLKASSAAISSTWRPTLLRPAQLVVQSGTANLVYPDLNDPKNTLIVPNVIQPETFEYRHPVTGRTRRPKFPELSHRAQISAAMTYTVAQQGPVLIYCAQPNFAQAVADALMDRTEYGLLSGSGVPEQFMETPRLSAIVAEEWLGADHSITRQLRHGIGVHHASIPTAVQRAIEEDFRARRISALAATSTLAQGVNFPVRTLIVHSTSRWDEETGSRKTMLARDFWNIAGRVGRAGAETEGTVVFLTMSNDDQRDFQRYMSRASNVEPVEGALTALLNKLVEGRISSDELRHELDADLLALLVEEADVDLTDTDLHERIGQTLFEIQATRAGQNPSHLWQEMTTTANTIISQVPDNDERKVFSITGLSVASNIALRDHASLRHDELVSFFESALDSPLALISLMMGGLTACAEMTPRRDTEANHLEVLSGWLAGQPVSDLAHDVGADPIALTRFIEDYFGYRLPWGISAYLRIASWQRGHETIPEHLQSVPMLVKYGVPNPASAWLMALGMPSRRTAAHMAAKYLERQPNPSIGGMRKWLSRLSVDNLVATLGLPPESFDYAARVVLKAHGNDFLKRYYAGDSGLAVRVRVSLRFSPEVEALRARLKPGFVLQVLRDRDAPYRNSCFLSWNQRFLVRLPRRSCDLIALEIDSGIPFSADVLEVKMNDANTALVSVEIRPD